MIVTITTTLVARVNYEKSMKNPKTSSAARDSSTGSCQWGFVLTLQICPSLDFLFQELVVLEVEERVPHGSPIGKDILVCLTGGSKSVNALLVS
jgi:hypothetical protein